MQADFLAASIGQANVYRIHISMVHQASSCGHSHASAEHAQRMLVCRFEWQDGPLTRAAETGGWLLLENANLCSPAVLDRLNSLLEPKGSLLLNEAGSSLGQPQQDRASPSPAAWLHAYSA